MIIGARLLIVSDQIRIHIGLIMILTKQYLDKLCHTMGWQLDGELITYLLAEFEEEPFPEVRDEEDLFYQVSEKIKKYEKGTLDVTVLPKEERLRLRYESLKEDYYELLGEVTKLRKLVEKQKDKDDDDFIF